VRFRPLVIALVILLLPAAARPQSFTANDAASLSNSILASNAMPGGAITLTSNITLTQSLPIITGNVSIIGNGYTIDANNSGRVFFVQSGTVSIANVTVANGLA